MGVKLGPCAQDEPPDLGCAHHLHGCCQEHYREGWSAGPALPRPRNEDYLEWRAGPPVQRALEVRNGPHGLESIAAYAEGTNSIGEEKREGVVVGSKRFVPPFGTRQVRKRRDAEQLVFKNQFLTHGRQ